MIISELDRMWPDFKYSAISCVEGLRKTTRHFKLFSLSLSLSLREYETEMLIHQSYLFINE
jgi:hypothetical protein